MKSKREKIHVLLVDDEEEFLASTARALGRRGLEVITAPDGQTALELLKEKPVEIAVLDVRMPGIDGIELFHRIHRLLPDLPVLLLTAYGSIPQAFMTTREGVFDFLAKPCDIDDLMDRITSAWEEGRRRTGMNKSGLCTEHPDGGRIRVLLIDDEVDFAESLTPPLERRNMEVISSPSGEDALECLRRNLVDVVVLDIRLPGMDGLEVLRAIKQETGFVEVILLTGHPSVENAVLGLKRGAFDYIAKPPDIEELVLLIRRAFTSRLNKTEKRQKEIVDRILENHPD